MTVSTRVLLAFMAFGALLAAAFMAVGSAHANPNDLDNEFLSRLQRDGVTYSGSITGELETAHWICAHRMAGVSEVDVATYIYQNSPLDRSHTAALVVDAETVYCPGFVTGGEA